MTEIFSNTVCVGDKTNEKQSGSKMHFVYLLLKIKKKLFLFLLALLPLFVESSKITAPVLTTILFQLIATAAVLIPAAINYNCLRWYKNKDFICCSSGFFSRSEKHMPINKIKSISVIKTPFLSLFRSVRVELRSSEGRKKPEIILYLSPKQAESLFTGPLRPSRTLSTLIPRIAPFLLMSASRANFAVGFSTTALFILSLGGNIKLKIPEIAYGKLSQTAAYILPYLPPFISVAAACFVLGWTVHFLKICFSDARQVTTVSKDSIITVHGLISSRLLYIKKSSISSCVRKHTILSSFFKQSGIDLSYIGQGINENIHSLSAWHISDYNSACHDLIDAEKATDTTVHISANAHLIWWMPYALTAAFTALVWIRLFILSPYWFPIFSYISIILFVVLAWKCIVGFIGASEAKIEFSGQYISISSVRGLSFYSQKIFLGKISRFSVTRTVFQKYRNLCSVSIRAAGTRFTLRCRNLPYDIISVVSERIK